MKWPVKDTHLEHIYKKIRDGVRLDHEDGLALYETNHLLALGYLTNIFQERLNGNNVYYVQNQHINYSNICINGCLFCAFSKKRGDPGAYEMSIDDIAQVVRENLGQPIKEIHIVGGIHPDLPLDYYVSVLKTIRQIRPNVHIKAFTPVEVAHIADISEMSVEDTLKVLKEAGLNSMPGGGAEIFSPRVRKALCPKKLSGQGWLHVSKCAHRLDIPSNATMLYGHIETYEERVSHLLTLREAQDETGGFLCFIPLAFHPRNTKLSHLNGPTGVDDLKNLAVSRLILDNIPHIKAYWVGLTPKLAQIALSFGADDLDGTIMRERVTHTAGAQSPYALTRNELIRLIEGAGRKPVERDALYQEIS